MVLIGFGSSLAFAAAVTLAALAVVAAMPPANARCVVPGCRYEFCIPEEHRGTAAELTRTYRCPNCNVGAPPATLYKPRR
jgi:hypothetical protein